MSTIVAISDVMELNELQVQEIQSAMKEADKDEFATEEQIADVFNKWGLHAEP